MALYAIGDLHLSLSGEKPMDVFGEAWRDHVNRLKQGFSALGENDVCVICGDLSWGIDLRGAAEDFRFIGALPGRKIILKGNHDYWWTTVTKAKLFFAENDIDSIDILNNNFFEYGSYAICGTRGWFYEEERGGEHDKKIMRRELMRLETSLCLAGEREKLVFLHYPPIYQAYRCEELLELLERYRVRLCCYGHIHGRGCASAPQGFRGGTDFRLVSADYLGFAPMKLLD